MEHNRIPFSRLHSPPPSASVAAAATAGASVATTTAAVKAAQLHVLRQPAGSPVHAAVAREAGRASVPGVRQAAAGFPAEVST